MPTKHITFYCVLARTPITQQAMHERYGGAVDQLVADIEIGLLDITNVGSSSINPCGGHSAAQIRTYRDVTANGDIVDTHILDFDQSKISKTHAVTGSASLQQRLQPAITVRQERLVNFSERRKHRQQEGRSKETQKPA